MYNIAEEHAAWVKLDILAHGVNISPSLTTLRQKASFAPRRSFYNSPVWDWAGQVIPQELRILDLVVGLNSYGESPWHLTWSEEGRELTLVHESGWQLRPILIDDLRLFTSNKEASLVANLYGGSALAFFSPRSCYFFADGTQCGFCSLAGTAKEVPEFRPVLTSEEVGNIVTAAVECDADRIEQVMIVGGNMRDLNRGFRHHSELALAASDALSKAGLTESISIHMATMPPRDLGLLEELRAIRNVHVMFNLEVWDTEKFAEICVGKEQDYGRGRMLRALERLRDTIGAYRAHSLLVTGLEPSETSIIGITALAEMGISPIVNIYHSDRHSRMGLGARPTFGQLAQVAHELQALYARFPIRPYWRNCGRNAIDAEANRGLFKNPIPNYLLEKQT